jgi:hypothetical protein
MRILYGEKPGQDLRSRRAKLIKHLELRTTRLLVSGFEEKFGRGRRVPRQAKEQAIQRSKEGAGAAAKAGTQASLLGVLAIVLGAMVAAIGGMAAVPGVLSVNRTVARHS